PPRPGVAARPPPPPAAPAGLPLSPREPARPRPAPAPAGPPLCRTCLLRGTSRPALVRGWHRSRWRPEAACAEHASGLTRVVPLAGAPAPAATAAPTGAPAPARRPAPPRRRRPALVAAGGILLAGAAAILGVLASA